MKKIASFSVDHDKIRPGIYISRIDGDITSFDLRTRTPNAGNYMDNVTMHSVEHMLATYLRGGEIGKSVIYFGPMGCRTGFYLLTRDLEPVAVLEALKKALAATVAHEGAIFGNTLLVQCLFVLQKIYSVVTLDHGDQITPYDKERKEDNCRC